MGDLYIVTISNSILFDTLQHSLITNESCHDIDKNEIVLRLDPIIYHVNYYKVLSRFRIGFIMTHNLVKMSF